MSYLLSPQISDQPPPPLAGIGSTNRPRTTLPAVRDAVSLVAPGGLLLVAVYPGHAKGRAEGEALGAWFAALSRFEYSVSCLRIVNSPDAPYFFALERKK